MVLKKYARRFVALILAIFFVASLSVSAIESNTFDEKAHIPAAYSYVRYGDMRLNPEHPPLLKDLAGLPLLFLRPAFPIADPLWTDGINEQWKLGEKFLFESGNDPDVIAFWSRLPVILTALLLGAFIYAWTKELAGTLAGLFALLLYAADPNVLAHSHYVTTDIGIATFVFIASYCFVRFLKRPAPGRVLLAGLTLGLAQVAKFSAVLLFPLFGVVLISYALALRLPDSDTPAPWKFRLKQAWKYICKYVAIVSLAFIVIWFFYLLNTWNMPMEVVRDTAEASFGKPGVGQVAKQIVVSMSAVPVLAPLSEYFLGVFMVFGRVASGNTVYFLGQVSDQATPTYFPIIFILKETLPFLFLLFFSLAYALFRIVKRLRENGSSIRGAVGHSVRAHTAQYVMAGFILLYSLLSVTGNLNIGFRHLFPILPFLYVLTAKTVFDFIRRHQENECSRLSLNVLSGIFALWIATIPVLAYPNYLSYFNPIGGGSSEGYRYATDSNYDWGQDLKKLKAWVDGYNRCAETESPQNCQRSVLRLDQEVLKRLDIPSDIPIDTIRIDYFGGASVKYYFGDDFIGWYGEREPEPGWYAVSALFFQESIYKKENAGKMNYSWLAKYPMVARAGESIFIFYVAPDSLGR
jgi:hypothetical protein